MSRDKELVAAKAEIARLNNLVADWSKCNLQIVSKLSELDRCLSDPVAVHVNLLRHSIARPSIDNIIHIYGRDVLIDALRVRRCDKCKEGK